MAVYIVGRMHIQHRDWWDEYFAQVPALIAQHSANSWCAAALLKRWKDTSACPTLCLLSNSRARRRPSHSGTLPILRHSLRSDKPAPRWKRCFSMAFKWTMWHVHPPVLAENAIRPTTDPDRTCKALHRLHHNYGRDV